MADEERPKIADKVRFWEEQDRINRELIPRVLKQHELFTAHIETHDSVATRMAETEARLAQQIREGHAELEARLNEQTREGLDALQRDMSSSVEESRQKIADVEARSTATIKAARHQSFLISSTSIAMAVVAIVLAVAL